MTFVEPLDFERILINNLAGTVEIFIFISFIAIGAAASAMKIPKSLTMTLMAIFTIVLAGTFPALYLLTVFIAGLIATNAVAKIITR